MYGSKLDPMGTDVMDPMSAACFFISSHFVPNLGVTALTHHVACHFRELESFEMTEKSMSKVNCDIM